MPSDLRDPAASRSVIRCACTSRAFAVFLRAPHQSAPILDRPCMVCVLYSIRITNRKGSKDWAAARRWESRRQISRRLWLSLSPRVKHRTGCKMGGIDGRSEAEEDQGNVYVRLNRRRSRFCETCAVIPLPLFQAAKYAGKQIYHNPW